MYKDATKTAYYSKVCYKWGKSRSSVSPNLYLGYKVRIEDGYKFSLSGLSALMAVGANFTYKVDIVSKTGSVLFTAGPKSITSYNNNTSTNAQIDSVLSSKANLQNLTDSFYVRAYMYVSAASKYFCFPKLTLTGTVAAAAASDAYDIHIGKNNADYSDESLTNTSGTTWSKTISLDASSYYEFKVKKTPAAGDAVYYGNNGKITATTSPAWDFSTSDGNCKLYTTVSGSYTFSWDTSNNKLTITYPSGSHSTKRVYMRGGSTTWCDASKYYVHSWGVSEYNTQVQESSCDGYYADIIWYNDYFQFTRNSSEATAYNNNVYNYSQDLTYDSEKPLWTCTGYSDSKGNFSSGTYSTPTYTISYNTGSTTYTGGNSISGSKSNESKTCGVDFTLPSAVFTTTGYTQTGWSKTDGGAQYAAVGGSYTDNAAQTFYPVWTVQNYTLTWNLNGGKVTTAGTGAAVNATGSPSSSVAYGTSLTTPVVAKDNYTFTGWNTTPASTMPAANTTYTAQWSANQYDVTLTYDEDEITKKSGSTGTDAATYGTNYVATFQAKSGYALQDDVTVTIGASSATKGTEYTWSVSAGVGTLTVTGSYITDDITVEVDADVDVTTYSVTYAKPDGATGTPPTDATDYSSGDEVTVKANTDIAKDGTTFRGWTDGTTFYLVGQKFNITSDVTLTAVLDGGSSCTEYEILLSDATQESSTKPYGQYITGRGKVMRKPDGSDVTALGIVSSTKACNGSTKAFKTGSSMFAVQTYNAINKLTFYGYSSSARTIENVYASSSYSSYGDDIKSTCTITNNITKNACGDATIEFPNTIPANNYIKIVLSGNIDSLTSVLFENCTVSNFTVTFADGNTKPASHLTWPDNIAGVPTGKKILAPSTTPTASGYIFGGWYTNAACSSAFSFSGTITKDTTLYAKWTAKTQPTQYSVTGDSYYCPGGTATITLANSQTGINYQLLKGGSASGDPKAGTGSALNWTVNAAGTYTVKAVENATYAERAMSGSVTVAAYAAASISTQPTTAVAAGASEDFTVGSGMVVAGNGLSYQWYTCLSDGSSASSISGAESSTYTTSKSKGTYYFKVGVTGTCGSTVYSNVITVTVTASHSVTAVTSTGTTTYGTVAAGSSSVAEGATTTITASPATGYQVTNWAVSGTGASISPSGSSNSNTTTLTMGTADATVTVTFGAKTYSVTLNRGIGSSGSSSVTMTYNSSSHTSITAPTAPTGYTFAGWYSGEGGTGSQVMNASGTLQASVAGYTDGSGNWTKDGTCTLYAKYTANYPSGYLYITDVMATPETGATASATDASYDADLDGSFSHSGLAHWARASVKSSGVYTLTFASPITAGATAAGVAVDVWWGVDNTSNASTYIYLNGTSDSDEIGHYKSNGESQRKTLLEQLKNVQKVGTTSVSSLQLKCNDNPGSTWFRVGIKEIPGYQLTYNANGGNGAPSASYQPNATITLSSTIPTRSGYRFLGWNTEEGGGGTRYASGASFAMPAAATTLYAEWQEAATLEWLPNVKTAESSIGTNSKTSTNTTRIPTSAMSAISNYGSLTITSSAKDDLTSKIQAPTSYDAGKYMYVTFTVPAHYEFVPSSVSVKVQPVDAVGDVKLELIDASAHSISKTQSSVASGSISTVTMTNGSSVAFKGTVTLKIYCYGASTGTYRLGSPIAITGDINELEGYTVTYADGGATSGSVPVDASSPYAEGATVTVLGNKGSLVKNGYTFGGWNDGSTDYEADDTFEMPAEDVTLTAQWTPNDYTITYHLNGASWAGAYDAPATYTVGTGATLPIAANMTNTGYTFDGWYANSDLSTGGVKTEVGTSEYGNKEFWAKWTENTYTITYNANGGSGTTSSTNGHYVTVADNGFTAPDGKIFTGWNTLSTGLGESYSEGEEIELTANMTLYAIWADNYNVTWGDVQIAGAGDAVTPNLGGGNYTITATIATWTGDVTDIELGDVTSGVTASITGTTSSPSKTVTITFAVGTSVVGDEIELSINIPAHGDYGAKTSTEEIDIERCEGSGSTTVFSLTSITGVGDNLSTSGKGVGASYDASSLCALNSVSDGVYVCACSSSGSLSGKNLSYGSTNKTWSFGSNNVYLALYSATGFAAGDVITWVEGENKSTSPSFAKAAASTLDGLKTTDYYAAKGTYQLTMSSVTTPGSGNSFTYTGTIPTGFVSSNWLIVFRDGSSFAVKSITVTRPDDSELISPTLTWSPLVSSDAAWDGDNDRLNKRTSDADFTFTATQNKNSLGAITYASSNTSVVTVNATTGKVHVEGAGDATITATLAESGCYNKATATYAIHVVDDCDDEAGTISTEDLGCEGIRMTVTGHTGEGAGATYQWYKDGATIGGATSATYTATEPGEYYVEVTNDGEGHCTKASTNTVTLEASESATASKIVNQWYVKNGRRTPDVALVQTTNATGFYVKIGDDKIWDEANDVTIGFGGCPFRLGDDGIIYLNGQTSAGAAPSGLTTGDVTLKITATACGGNSSELSIVIHKQAATTAKSVAFVVDGTKGGEITAFTAAHATTSPLYVYLDSVGTAASARQFSLTGRNAYWSTVDSTLKAHYSQFDVILITDDPSTQTVPDGVSGKDAYKTQGYINALGALIDVRPILTMEAFVSALANWKSKGINGNPTSPNPRQYAMKLDCKDHEIFNGLEEGANVVATVEDGTTYWTVTMVDKTKSPYSALATDATDYNGTPALQGFSASDVSSLLLLGEISDGAHYAGVERQEEPAARLMLLGLNAKALPNALTEEGKIIIENALKYLLKTNMEEVDDCSNYFTGATSTDWNTPTNWSKGVVPNSPMVRARILKPCEISSVTAKAAQVDIVTSGTSSKFKGGSGTCTGKLTINPTGALVVGGEIRTAEAPYYNKADLMPTDTNNLVINTNATNQAALVFNNDKGDTKATVNLYSLGRTESSAYQFQYFAVPMSYIDVNPAFAGQGIYTYVWTEASGWERRGYYGGLEAFEGVGITTTFTEAKTYQMKGTLASTEEREITLTAGGVGSGQNIVGNSWLAPIDIASLKTGLLEEDVDEVVYIYCTGNDGGSVGSQSTETAGQWLAIPIDASGWPEWDGLKVIPAMQGFCIIANSETTLTLNYNDHVRSTASDKLTPYLRAPKRNASHEGIDLIRIRVADSQTHTDLYLFEGESFSEEFDNGWEAKYMSGDGRSAKLYAETAIGPMAVVAQPEYEGTVLGFAPGKETEYTFTFSGPNKEYYLNDLKEKKSTLISEEESYMFTFEEGDTNRFYISKTPINAPSVATGTENTGDGVKARKVLVNDKLYIILNGRVYSAEGVMVK